ncbi:pentatricopeptide repeat-containing protein At2g13600-like [Selaginella moellendorffii]|uniref:pentatricopeptide repeat-containing protein At2g13600-like n=1 Tax=Selaginella moellendorffii TaxID=88036 RepID=UPI000D1C4093|nr:pentatricopeptide repeat-containing protein At2g13600-like [Selaginella moellendorffii]XP_024538654.1 pentatricopeptide repeat-containing protein At2g13600-like [Selaginella moellendorffii]|eukprot:XP_024538653.1 pentatricopeptide repeat-containing protein At2g13600-like [Selaginella moellendorffii]
MDLHAQARRQGCDFANQFVSNALIDMYAKSGSMADARRVFDRMSDHTVVSWTALMLGYTENGEAGLTLDLLGCMEGRGCEPNARTFMAGGMACIALAVEEKINSEVVKVRCCELGAGIHSLAVRSRSSDVFLANTLIDLFSKCGSMVKAQSVFEKMPCHNVVSWTALTIGYAENGEGEQALESFSLMRATGVPPDGRSFLAALVASGSVAALGAGKRIQGDVYRFGMEKDAIVPSCLVDFYGKCGCVLAARQLFDSLTSGADLTTWNSLIVAYSRQGDITQAFELFHRMQDEGVQADDITFLALLSACSHVGLLDKGRRCFHSMLPGYNVRPGLDHYHCMVDILGRGNELEEALALVKSMPFKPDALTWRTVLAGCRKWKNVELGRLAFERLLELDGSNGAAYVLMGAIYGSTGMWEEQAKILSLRNVEVERAETKLVKS